MILNSWSRALFSPFGFDTDRHSEESERIEPRFIGAPRRTKNLGLGCARNHRPWPALLLMAALPLAVACSSGRSDAPTVGLDQPSDTIITKQVTASVLITPKPEDTSIEIDTIKVSPSSLVADPGDTIQLSAQALGAGGQPIPNVDYIWTVVDPRAGNVTREGRFQAGAVPGVFDEAVSVTALQNTPFGIQHQSASVRVVVVGEAAASALETVTIIPRSPTVLQKQIYRMRAIGFDEKGVVIPGVSFVWQVNDSALGRLNDIGYLTVEGDEGIYKDAVTVTGIWEGARVSANTDVNVIRTLRADDFMRVQVLPQRFFLDPGDRLHLRAVALNGLGELVSGTELRWSIVDSEAGAITGAGVFVAGDLPGIYTEAVRVDAVVPGERGFVHAVDFSSVVIRKARSTRRLETLRLVPDTVIVEPGGRSLLSVQAVDEFSNPAGDLAISWQATQEGIGQIDSHGSFKAAYTPGIYPDALTVTVQQQLGDELITKSGSADVIITGPLTSLEIRPTLATIVPGRAVHFSVIGEDQIGNKLSGLLVRWRVSNEAIGTIDAFGNLIAGDISGFYQDAILAEVVQTIPKPR